MLEFPKKRWYNTGMEFQIILGVLVALLVIILLISFLCFLKVFYSPKRKVLGADEYEIPPGEIYEPYRDEMVGWMKETRAMEHEDVEIKSFDGLTLRGSYFEYQKGAPIELLFHGYQGNSERDLCGSVQRCFALGRNALLIDQRGSGKSDGSVISFGIIERKDCLAWVDFAIQKFGEDAKLILTGISMGAATVLMAAGEPLPKNVVCILGDCPYSSAKDIIQKIIRDMHLPVWLCYPFVWLGARIFGRFHLEETSPVEAMKTCTVPVMLIHGAADDFVPPEMSQKIYDACQTTKKLVLVPNAGHGLAYPIDIPSYMTALKDFDKECGIC